MSDNKWVSCPVDGKSICFPDEIILAEGEELIVRVTYKFRSGDLISAEVRKVQMEAVELPASEKPS